MPKELDLQGYFVASLKILGEYAQIYDQSSPNSSQSKLKSRNNCQFVVDNTQ